ncbi:MAG TPA: hemerythrin domain-containing protein [candidate division Zixibacteria bacterium]|nr:hemerythrin domain-containing protein [candidate division Zixibacteria bacterium]
MATLADRFTQIFREEHRVVRDALLDLIRAFQNRDRGSIRALLEQIAKCTGPHFRYEEESLYPSLREIFGDDYVEKLLGDHDAAIGAARKLVELAGRPSLEDEDVSLAVRLARGILPHVSDCDGLSIMVERLSGQKVQAILDTRDRSLQQGLDLLKWAAEVRTRPAVAPV